VNEGGFLDVGLAAIPGTEWASDYWVVPNQADVRPYAILLRRCDEFGSETV
jgi:hypothetical protein